MDSKDAILKTLLYADIFDYPLTKEEILKLLIASKKINKQELISQLRNIKSPITKSKNYYFLEKRQDLVKTREKREKESIGKLKTARTIIKKISKIPSVKFIGISGALSMHNSDKDDDIDIFVITKKNLVWTTRFLLIMYLKMLGVYRNKNSKSYANKICLNMILDEEKMNFEKKKNLYLAHEIVQLIPVFDKDNIYEKFVKENDWIKSFLANATYETRYIKTQTNLVDYLLNNFLQISQAETILEYLQKKYMEKNITKETIRKGFLAFHPFDYKADVLQKFNLKIKEYKLLNRSNKTRI